MEVKEYREEDFVPDYAREEELESGSCGEVLTGVEEDAEQLLDPSEEMENLIVVVAQARPQLSRSVSRCWEYGVTELSACWGCRRMESWTHIRTCQPFELEWHLVEYVGMVEVFSLSSAAVWCWDQWGVVAFGSQPPSGESGFSFWEQGVGGPGCLWRESGFAAGFHPCCIGGQCSAW